MKSALRLWMYGVMSYSHFCEANSAVQITSEEKMSQSPDFACWRWMNCWRWASAEAGNSSSLTVMPVFLALYAFTHAWALPAVSLPWQYVTVPLAPLARFGSRTFAPEVVSPPLPPAAAPPPPPLLLLPPLSLPPQAATTREHSATAIAAPKPKRPLMRPLLQGPTLLGL